MPAGGVGIMAPQDMVLAQAQTSLTTLCHVGPKTMTQASVTEEPHVRRTL